jgi:cytidine deaminase
MNIKEIRIQYAKYETENELDSQSFQILEEAKKALDTAYSPYSNFQVGAALKLSNGQIIRGSNQENAAYPSGLCAERTAIFYAGSQFPNEKIEEMVVLARRVGETELTTACPCGACRQALLEYEEKQNQPILITFKMSKQGFVRISSIADLLPFKFDSTSL